MDRVIEKTRIGRLKMYWPYAVFGSLLIGAGCWMALGSHVATLKVSRDELTIGEVRRAEFKDYVRTNG